MNAEKYLNNFDVNAIYKKILEKNKISSMEDNYSRHFTELKKKFQSLIPTLAKKQYFNEMPSFNEDLLLDVIILNTPFVPVEKRANFKVFLEKKTFSSFKNYIKEYIFPYQDSDKDKLENNVNKALTYSLACLITLLGKRKKRRKLIKRKMNPMIKKKSTKNTVKKGKKSQKKDKK